MLVKIKTLEKQIFIVHIEKNITVSLLKEIIENIINIDKLFQRLLFQGSPLVDEKTIEECKIEENSIIHVLQTLQYEVS